MSILLESLNQSKTQSEMDVPSVTDSHFDDEMLSDEWLLTRVKFWKLTAITLSLILLLVLIGAYLLWPESSASMRQADQQTMSAEQTNKPNTTESQKFEKIPLPSKTEPLSKQELVKPDSELSLDLSAKPNKASSDVVISSRAKYQPKIIVQKNTTTMARDQVEYHSQPTSQNIELTTIETPINFESLSNQEKQQFPELQINSYAVSNNSSKSFVVLNNIFYGLGETIAPHLVLVLIDNNGIVLKYNNRFIRKKYAQ